MPKQNLVDARKELMAIPKEERCNMRYEPYVPKTNKYNQDNTKGKR